MKLEINIGKKHFWAMIAVIVLLFSITLVIAKTTTPAYTDDKPFHDELYADVIVGKSVDKVIIDDDVAITGKIYGQLDCRIVENEGHGPDYVSLAQCDGDEWMISGGGSCENGFGSVCPELFAPPNKAFMGFTTDNGPMGNGWFVDCYGMGGEMDVCSKAWAVCCKK